MIHRTGCSAKVLRSQFLGEAAQCQRPPIRLPQDLKERIARAAERKGTTAHGFILEAIAEKAEYEERRGAFQEEAERRYAQIVASGKTVSWSEMRRYLERQLVVKKVTSRRPVRMELRELVIGSDARGYVALYRYVVQLDTVFALAIRGQKEAGFTRS